MRTVIVAATLLLCALPGFAEKRRAISPGKSSCVGSISRSPCMLAFVSERDGNSEIYVINIDGTGLLRLTDHRANDTDPAWSPDGSRIAFASDRMGDSDIYVMDADGSNLTRRTLSGANTEPSWSADGTTIAFSSIRGGQRAIYVTGADGSGTVATRIGYDRGWNTSPAWSPDGAKIAFGTDWRAFDIIYDVHIMNSDGSGPAMLLAAPFFGPAVSYFQPSWSRDGRRIAAVGCDELWGTCYPTSSIVIASADGSGLKTIARTIGLSRPTWSPDGTLIAFSSRPCQSCVGELRYVSVDGTASGVLFANGHDAAWRP